MGGSYARILKRFGFHISAITLEQSAVDYALNEKIIDEGSTEVDARMIGEADVEFIAARCLTKSNTTKPPVFRWFFRAKTA